MGVSPQQYRICIGMFNSRNLSSCKTGQQKETKNNVKVQRGKLIQISMFLLLCLAFLCVSSLHGNQNVKLQRSHCNYKTFSTRSCLIVNHNFVAKITNGNRRSNGIKLCQWNAGGVFLSTKQPELQNIVSGYKLVFTLCYLRSSEISGWI